MRKCRRMNHFVVNLKMIIIVFLRHIIKRCTRSWECSEYIRVARGARRENKKHNVKNLQQKCIVKTDFKSSL